MKKAYKSPSLHVVRIAPIVMQPSSIQNGGVVVNDGPEEVDASEGLSKEKSVWDEMETW